ncbi:PAS domain-containing sensor histidine kinase [Phyllobacterium sp. YR531]|uniref:sensor histidine kinase n=1 Tax=Phyllobacterium sp. YR531 TaxID=1144343 RepID=UPI00026F877C|nr:PAS domain-containing sensor histidine kinase [Phyllobacterium sp. YR531]EJN01382.1 signal transduction histidine kinase [Phyllobacterium sp. YR531]
MPIHSATHSDTANTGSRWWPEIASRFGDLCKRWVNTSVACPVARDRDARMAGAFLAMPLLLAIAALTNHVLAGEMGGIVSMVIGVLALPMIFCGALVMSKDSRKIGLGALIAYGASICAIGMASPMPNLLLWLLAVAIPLEAWFIYRTQRPLRLAGGLSVAVLIVLLAATLQKNADVGLSPLTLLASLAYCATLLIRIAIGLIQRVAVARRDDRVADLETAIDGVVVSLGADGLVKSLSSKAQEQFGIARNLLIGTPLFERVHVADRVQFLGFLSDMKRGAAKANVDVKLRCVAPAKTSGQPHHVRFATYHLSAVPHSQGEGFLVVATDISQAVADRSALVAARREVETVEITKGRFLSTVSHELRTPLNSIIGFSDILLQEICGKLPDGRQREYVELVHRSGNHLLSVVNAILDVSKIEAGAYPIHAESFAFKDTVAMVHDMMTHQAAQKNVTLCDRVSPRIGNVIADNRAIHQVLINLVSNAVKFTETGGVVTIDAQIEDDMLVFSVSDTGIGIAEADLKTLGQPFRQVQNDYTRAQEGTGLGLATVKGLVGLHGGELTIKSVLGQGTIVDVRIPRSGRIAANDELGDEFAANIVDFKEISDVKGGSHGEARKSA